MIGYMTDEPVRDVAAFRPNPARMEALVRGLAADSKKVHWAASMYKTHAESRMEWRGITDRMMFEVLRTGNIKGEIQPGKNPGEWKLKMCKVMKGQREVGVVTVVIREQELFVKTVEWEDRR